jgi:hypothetical protein
MKKFVIAASMLALAPLPAFSQSREAIGSSGNIAVVQDLNVRWNMGGIVNGLMTSGGVQLSNGYYVQQELQALSVEQPEVVSRITMYPNPTESYVKLTIETNLTVRITDMNGREIKSERLTPSRNAVDVSGLTPGTYIVSVQSDNKTNTYKLIKQ